MTSYRDGSTLNVESGIEVVGGKGSDGLAHPFNLDTVGRLYVNVQGFVAGAFTPATDGVYIGLQTTPLVASGVVSSSGTNAFVTATPAKAIQVLGYELQAKSSVVGTVTVKFYDDTPAQILGSPEWDFNAREGVTSMAPPGTFKWQGGSGKALQVNLSVSQPVMAHVVYTLV